MQAKLGASTLGVISWGDSIKMILQVSSRPRAESKPHGEFDCAQISQLINI